MSHDFLGISPTVKIWGFWFSFLSSSYYSASDQYKYFFACMHKNFYQFLSVSVNSITQLTYLFINSMNIYWPPTICKALKKYEQGEIPALTIWNAVGINSIFTYFYFHFCQFSFYVV